MPDLGSQVKHSDIIFIVDEGWHQQNKESTMFQLLIIWELSAQIMDFSLTFNLLSIWPDSVADLAKVIWDYFLLMCSLGLTQISKTIVHHMTCGFVYLSIVESIMIIFKKCICSEFML